MNQEYLHAKAYITRPQGKCWIGQCINNGKNMKKVSRYTEDMLFSCEYDGESLGDEFVTRNIEQALAWLYAEDKVIIFAMYDVLVDDDVVGWKIIQTMAISKIDAINIISTKGYIVLDAALSLK